MEKKKNRREKHEKQGKQKFQTMLFPHNVNWRIFKDQKL